MGKTGVLLNLEGSISGRHAGTCSGRRRSRNCRGTHASIGCVARDIAESYGVVVALAVILSDVGGVSGIPGLVVQGAVLS